MDNSNLYTSTEKYKLMKLKQQFLEKQYRFVLDYRGKTMKLRRRDLKFIKPKKTGLIGQVHIRRGINNIFVTLTDLNGKVITGCSSGFVGFTGLRKTSPQAVEEMAKRVAVFAGLLGISNLEIILKMRVNIFVFALLRGLRSQKLRIHSFMDRIPVPHNGMKSKHQRRI